MKQRDSILDLVRGFSAILVMLGHLRAFLFIDFADAGPISPLWKIFYLATGLGHQAVMVFFVLSGYFVGGSVISAIQRGGFSWNHYASARLSRLWVVLVPALLLTLALDTIGSQLAPGAYMGQQAAVFSSGPTPSSPASLSITTFLGNLFFIQTIETPVYGSNGPLWSLANEFWYYVLFPLLILAIAPRMRESRQMAVDAASQDSDSIQHCLRPCLVRLLRILPGTLQLTPHSKLNIQNSSSSPSLRARAGLLAIAAVVLMWLPGHLSSLGIVWLMGAVVWWLAQHMKPVRLQVRMAASFALAPLFFGSLLASKSGHWAGSDWLVGVTFSFWMLTLLGPWKTSGWWSRLSTGMSEISYTLYVVHFPILFFVAAIAMAGRQLTPDLRAALIFIGLAIGIIAISTLLWWLFERNTPHVRRIMQSLPRPGARPTQSA